MGERELDLGRHRDHEWALLSRLVRASHYDVSLRVSIENELLARLVPWHELGTLRVDDGLLGGLSGCLRVHIEANHTAYHVHTHLLLPYLGRSRQRDLHAALTMRRVKLEYELGVGGPSEFLSSLLIRLVVQMATTTRLVSPLTLENYVLSLLEHLDLDKLRRENYKFKVKISKVI